MCIHKSETNDMHSLKSIAFKFHASDTQADTAKIQLVHEDNTAGKIHSPCSVHSEVQLKLMGFRSRVRNIQYVTKLVFLV